MSSVLISPFAVSWFCCELFYRMNPIDNLLHQAVQKTVDNHMARLYSVHRAGTGHALNLIIDICHSTSEPEVTINLFYAIHNVTEHLKIITTIRHDDTVDWYAWAAKAVPFIACLTSANLSTIFSSNATINCLAIFINSELDLTIINNLLFYLTGFTKSHPILMTVYSSPSGNDADIVEFKRIHQNWNAIRHLG